MTLKSGFRMGQGHWKVHQWINHVSFPIVLEAVSCTVNRYTFDKSTIALFCYAFYVWHPDGEVPEMRSFALVTLLQPPVLTPVSRSQTALAARHISLVEQASSYSSCSFTVRSFMIIQLFSIVILWPGPLVYVNLSCGIFHSRQSFLFLKSSP